MYTSLLYHAFCLKGVEFQSTKLVGSVIIFSAKMTDKFIKCPACSSCHATFKGHKKRWFRMSFQPIGFPCPFPLPNT